jgi:hypothetical protein
MPEQQWIITAETVAELKLMHAKAWDNWEKDEDNQYKLGFARGLSLIFAEIEADNWMRKNE